MAWSDLPAATTHTPSRNGPCNTSPPAGSQDSSEFKASSCQLLHPGNSFSNSSAQELATAKNLSIDPTVGYKWPACSPPSSVTISTTFTVAPLTLASASAVEAAGVEAAGTAAAAVEAAGVEAAGTAAAAAVEAAGGEAAGTAPAELDPWPASAFCFGLRSVVPELHLLGLFSCVHPPPPSNARVAPRFACVHPPPTLKWTSGFRHAFPALGPVLGKPGLKPEKRA